MPCLRSAASPPAPTPTAPANRDAASRGTTRLTAAHVSEGREQLRMESFDGSNTREVCRGASLPWARQNGHLADGRGRDAVRELEAQAWRGEEVEVDDAAAPGAAVDSHARRRFPLPLEPAAP